VVFLSVLEKVHLEDIMLTDFAQKAFATVLFVLRVVREEQECR